MQGSPVPGLGAWPGIVPRCVHGRLPQVHLVVVGPRRDGPLHGHRARRKQEGGVPVAAEPWAAPGLRPGLLPPPCVTHRLGGSVINKNASPGQPWPARAPSGQRTSPGAHPRRMNDHDFERCHDRTMAQDIGEWTDGQLHAQRHQGSQPRLPNRSPGAPHPPPVQRQAPVRARSG